MTETEQIDVPHMAATIPVGEGPSAVALTPDGTRAYVTNYGRWATHSR